MRKNYQQNLFKIYLAISIKSVTFGLKFFITKKP